MCNLTSFPFNTENPFTHPDIENPVPSIIQYMERTNGSDEMYMSSEIDSRNTLTGNSAYIKKVYVKKDIFQDIILKELMRFFKLKPITLKVLRLILNTTNAGLSEFALNVRTIMKEVGCSQASAFRALGELCCFKIIARGHSESYYYINPICNTCNKSVSFSICYVSEDCQKGTK